MSDNPIKKDVLRIVTTSPTKLTPRVLEKIIADKYNLNPKQIKLLIRDLVSDREITYSYKFGSTYLERSFDKPVRVSKHVVLKPPACRYQSKPHDIVVQIKSGAAFGDGHHPTTRLAIQGIEYVCLTDTNIANNTSSIVLDVGTGSGILVVTAVLFGISKGLGIDIDPCARAEAYENIIANGLENRIVISKQSVESIDQMFSLITANLRFPTLKKMAYPFAEMIPPQGFIILSGIKVAEMQSVLEVYTKRFFRRFWSANELGWAAVVLQRCG
jgi:ribosomal protein L11 methyltransferase